MMLEVPGVEKAKAELEAKGLRLGKIGRWEHVVWCHGKDPEGNPFQLTEPVRRVKSLSGMETRRLPRAQWRDYYPGPRIAKGRTWDLNSKPQLSFLTRSNKAYRLLTT